MTAVDWVKVAVLGPLAAIAFICVLLWLLSSLGLLDHEGWVFRDERRRRRRHRRGRRTSTDFTVAERAALYERMRRTEQWFDLDDAVLTTDFKAWEAMPTVPHPTEPPLSNDHEEV